MVDSDSSVDCVQVDGKTYRLKCDCCRSKRADTQFDFHPCKIEKCTFSICWPCLQRWKEQSDKDITKRFECPQCHTEYDTNLVHHELSKPIIARVNQRAKAIRKKKKRKKKREQEQNQKAKKTELSNKLLRMRLEQANRKRNKKKKEPIARKKPSTTHDGNTHILNKHRVILRCNGNTGEWNERMVSAVFGRIGPIQSYKVEPLHLIVTYKKAQSDKARRILLYLFDLQLSIMADPIHNHNTQSKQDTFNPKMRGGTLQFLVERDKNTNWNEYSVPAFDVVPPGCRRWIQNPPKRLTKPIFIDAMQKRSKLKSQSRRAPPPPNPMVHKPPPPKPMLHKAPPQTMVRPTPPLMIRKTQSNPRLPPPRNKIDPLPSNSASALLPIHHSQRVMSAASFSMSDIPSNHNNNNNNNNRHNPVRKAYTANNGTMHRSHRREPPPLGPPGIAPPGIAPLGIAPPGMGPPGIGPPGIGPPGIGPPGIGPPDNEWNVLNGGTHKRKRDKISNILRFKPKTHDPPPTEHKTHDPPPMEQKTDPQTQINISWKCNGMNRTIRIISEDESSSDGMDHELDLNLNTPSVQSSAMNDSHNNNNNHNEYDYSTEEEEADALQWNEHTKAKQMEEREREKEKKRDNDTEIQAIEDMTIQQMLDNLEHFQADQVEAILAKLLPKQMAMDTDLNENSETNPDNNNDDDYDYEEEEGEGEADADDEEEDNLNAFERTQPQSHHNNNNNNNNNNEPKRAPNDVDLQFIAASMAVDPPRTAPPVSEREQEEKEAVLQANRINLSMERHRSDMKHIASYYTDFHLSKLPNIYFDSFQRKLKTVYKGKVSELIHYFTDLFSITYNQDNQMIVNSLVYSEENKHAKPSLNGKEARWTPKKKENGKQKQESPIQNNYNNNNGVTRGGNKAKNKKNKSKNKNKNKNNTNHGRMQLDDFRYGPSMMYTVPRAAPKAHSHIIGHTAAVGTANAYSANPYSRGTNRFNTSSARPYASQRGKRAKVKTYGDYEDELPHTPSGSEDDDY